MRDETRHCSVRGERNIAACGMRCYVACAWWRKSRRRAGDIRPMEGCPRGCSRRPNADRRPRHPLCDDCATTRPHRSTSPRPRIAPNRSAIANAPDGARWMSRVGTTVRRGSDAWWANARGPRLPSRVARQRSRGLTTEAAPGGIRRWEDARRQAFAAPQAADRHAPLTCVPPQAAARHAPLPCVAPPSGRPSCAAASHVPNDGFTP